jgi:glyceraldehyde 3-phosphate dehydrogenase
MSTKIGINGFGRIGRNLTRAILDRNADVKLVAVNDLAGAEELAHLLKYDSIHGPLKHEVQVDGEIVGGVGTPLFFKDIIIRTVPNAIRLIG